MHFGHEYIQVNVNLMDSDYAEHVWNMWSMTEGDKNAAENPYKDEYSFSFQLDANPQPASTIMYMPVFFTSEFILFLWFMYSQFTL